MIKQILTWSDFSSWKDLDKIFLIPLALNFKNVAFQAKWIFDNQNVLLYTPEGWFILLAKKWFSAKELATKFGIKWWGTDTMVQWRDINVLGLLK